VQRRPRRRIVEQRQCDAVLRRGFWGNSAGGFKKVRPIAVDDRRAAFAAKPALIPARAFIKLDQMLALEPPKILRLHANAAAKRRAMLLAALRAMAIQRRRQRPGDLELDAAAQAAAVDGGHGVLRRLQRRSDGCRRKRRLVLCGAPFNTVLNSQIRWQNSQFACTNGCNNLRTSFRCPDESAESLA